MAKPTKIHQLSWELHSEGSQVAIEHSCVGFKARYYRRYSEVIHVSFVLYWKVLKAGNWQEWCNIIQPPIWVLMTNSSLIFISSPRLWPRLMAVTLSSSDVFFPSLHRCVGRSATKQSRPGRWIFGDPQVLREIRRLWDRKDRRRWTSNVFPPCPVIQDGLITSWWHRYAMAEIPGMSRPWNCSTTVAAVAYNFLWRWKVLKHPEVTY